MSHSVISVVTPTLNAERYIGECLASVSRQGTGSIEHLVVDGGSTDATEHLVRATSAEWIRCPGQKQTAAINEGIRRASGDIVAWLNADDLYVPGSLAFVSELFVVDGTLDVVYGDCDVIGADGKLLSRYRPGPYDFSRLLRRGNSIGQPAVFLRRRVFDRIGYLDESLEFGMDYDLWLRLRSLRVRYVDRVLAAFRWHEASKTARNRRANWQELMFIVRRYGGGWTPHLAWAFMRAHVTSGRRRAAELGRL